MSDEQRREKKPRKRAGRRRGGKFRARHLPHDEELLPQADRKRRRAMKETLEELTVEELAETIDEY